MTVKMENVTFETAIAELEKIVEEMEKGNLPLERALQLYEQGVKYTAFCKKELSKAQLKLEELTAPKKEETTEV